MKTAVVTGASYGLGRSIVDILLNDGFKTYGISRSNPDIKNKDFVWVKTDLYNNEDIKNLTHKIEDDKIDLLVNNAGTAFEESALDITKDSFHRMFDLNFMAPIFVAKALFSKINNGLLINTSSVSDRLVDVDSGLYCASKAALNIFFDALGLENKNLKVFNLLPSYIDTPLQHGLSDKLSDFDWSVCMKPHQVAESVKYLVDHKNSLPSGARIIVVNNKLLSDIKDPEKLFYYNVDTKDLNRIK